MNNQIYLEAAAILENAEKVALNEMDTESYKARNKVMFDGRRKMIKKAMSEAKKLAKTDPKGAIKKYDEAIKNLEALRKEAENIPDDNVYVLALVSLLKYCAVWIATFLVTMLISQPWANSKTHKIDAAKNHTLSDLKAARDKEYRQADEGDGFFRNSRRDMADMRHDFNAKVVENDADFAKSEIKAARIVFVTIIATIAGVIGGSFSNIRARLNKDDAITIGEDKSIKLSKDAEGEITGGSSSNIKNRASVTRTNALVALDNLIKVARQQRDKLAKYV